jgi:hypothetical protein
MSTRVVCDRPGGGRSLLPGLASRESSPWRARPDHGGSRPATCSASAPAGSRSWFRPSASPGPARRPRPWQRNSTPASPTSAPGPSTSGDALIPSPHRAGRTARRTGRKPPLLRPRHPHPLPPHHRPRSRNHHRGGDHDQHHSSAQRPTQQRDHASTATHHTRGLDPRPRAATAGGKLDRPNRQAPVCASTLWTCAARRRRRGARSSGGSRTQFCVLPLRARAPDPDALRLAAVQASAVTIARPDARTMPVTGHG